jgi:transposase
MMLPFNGVNTHSVLIMDNCAIHHVSKVQQLLKTAGIVALFLPPYSPDLNPIEEAFSNVKKYLRKHDNLLQAVQDPTNIIKSAFNSITAEQWSVSESNVLNFPFSPWPA